MRKVARTDLNPSKRRYFQVIPLYMRADAAVSDWFAKHEKDIDAITGDALVVAWPEQVRDGDARAIGAIFDQPVADARYPGLLRSDLPCLWIEDGEGGHAILKLPGDLGELNAIIRAATDAVAHVATAAEMKSRVLAHVARDTAERSALTRLLLMELPVSKSTEKLIAVIFGVIFVAAILALAVVFPTPTPFQYTVFRIVLAIAAAGFVSMTPGFLEVTVSNWVRAGGALAVFVILFFYNPADLVTSATTVPQDTGTTTQTTTN